MKMHVVLLSVLVGISLAGSASAIVWDIDYNGDVNPWSATPAWSGYNYGDSVYGPRMGEGSPTNYYFHIDTSADNSHSEYYYINQGANYAPNFDEGCIMEAKIRWTNGTSAGGHNLQMGSNGAGGTTAGYISAAPYYYYSSGWKFGIRIGSNQYVDLLDTFTPTSPYTAPTPWYTIRMEVLGTQAEVFVNGVSRWSGNVIASSVGAIRFGDLSGGARGVVDYDDVRFAQIPEPATMLLIGLGGLVGLRRRR